MRDSRHVNCLGADTVRVPIRRRTTQAAARVVESQATIGAHPMSETMREKGSYIVQCAVCNRCFRIFADGTREFLPGQNYEVATIVFRCGRSRTPCEAPMLPQMFEALEAAERFSVRIEQRLTGVSISEPLRDESIHLLGTIRAALAVARGGG